MRIFIFFFLLFFRHFTVIGSKHNIKERFSLLMGIPHNSNPSSPVQITTVMKPTDIIHHIKDFAPRQLREFFESLFKSMDSDNREGVFAILYGSLSDAELEAVPFTLDMTVLEGKALTYFH